MEVPVSQAKAHLTELVRRAEAGDEIVLTRRGRAVARLVPIGPSQSYEERLAMIEAFSEAASAKAVRGPDAARSQDFLYDDDGLPL